MALPEGMYHQLVLPPNRDYDDAGNNERMFFAADKDRMIRFACIYCGNEIAVEDGAARRQVKCRACSHTVRVPARHATKPTETTSDETPGEHLAPLQLQRMSNKDIARFLLSKRRPAADRSEEAKRLAAAPFLPKYDDLTLFTLSATLLFFLLLLRHSPTAWTVSIDDERILTVGLSAFHPLGGLIAFGVVGMVASFFGVFFKWDKPVLLKYAMVSFAVLISAGTGLWAGYITIKAAHEWWTMIFPAWNILNSAALLLMFRAGLIGADCVTDEHAGLWQVLLTLVCISILVAIFHYGYRLHWTITYSICVCYTMTLNQTITDLLGKLKPAQT